MTAPTAILLARALSHLERAQLELGAGNAIEASDYIHKGITLIEEVLK